MRPNQQRCAGLGFWDGLGLGPGGFDRGPRPAAEQVPRQDRPESRRQRPPWTVRIGSGWQDRLGVLGLAWLAGCSAEARHIDAVDPPVGSAAGGETVVLSGSGFGDDLRVYFGDQPATVLGRSGSRRLLVRTPGVAARAEVAVSVHFGDGQVQTKPGAYTFHMLKLSAQVQRSPSLQPLALVGIQPSALDEVPHTMLAVATEQPTAVQLLQGTGDGRFQWAGRLPLRGVPSALAPVDIDGDGRSDLVVAEGSRGLVSFWLGQPTGGLLFGGEISPGCPPASLSAVQVLDDARPDLVIGCREGAAGGAATDPVRVLVNRWPQGPLSRFAPPRALSVAAGPSPGSAHVVATDLNGDGIVDIAAALAGRGRLQVWQGDGLGGFQATAALPTGSEPSSLVAADLNGDGRADLVVVDRAADGVTAALSIFHSTGDGLAARRVHSLPVGTTTAQLASVAPGAAGLARLWLATGPRPVLSVLGQHAAGAGQPLEALVQVAASAPLAWPLGVPLSRGGGPALLGLRGEGEQVAAWPAAAPSDDPLLSDTRPPVHSLVTADLSSDGRGDAAWLHGDRVVVLLGDGAKTDPGALPTPREVDLSSPRGQPMCLAAGDLNGDWLGDLVAGDAHGLQILLSQGPAQYQPAIAVDLGFAVDHLALADVDDDGHPDVVATSPSRPGLWLLLGRGNGTFQAPQAIGQATGQAMDPAGDAVQALRVVDLDGDGHRDVLLLSTQHLHILRGLGPGRWAPLQTEPLPAPAQSLSTADLDFDGRRDVVIQSPRARRLLVYRTGPDGALQLRQDLDTRVALTALVIEDLDRDGLFDAVAWARGGRDLHVFLGRSDGTLLPPLRIPALPVSNDATEPPTLPALVDLAALDLSGDGVRDILGVGPQGFLLWQRVPFP